MEGFIGKLVEKRNVIKRDSKSCSDPIERQRLKGLQNILKLFINTLYGCLVSPYFSIGNVCLADNITAKARVNVWLLCKVLNLRQSITDGGLYSPLTINYFREGGDLRMPGINTFSDIRVLQKHRSIIVKPLENIDWRSFYQDGMIFQAVKALDKMVTEVVNNFWNPYNLSLAIPIEHKGENTALLGIYTGKANYALNRFDETTGTFTQKYYRLRGLFQKLRFWN